MRPEIMIDNLIKNGIEERLANEIYLLYPDSFENLFKYDKCRSRQATGLFLHGEAGTGKTMRAIAQCIYNHGKSRFSENSFQFVNISELLFQIRRSFQESSNNTGVDVEGTIIDLCRNATYLIIDDLGTEKTTEFAQSILYLIINYRHGKMKPTFITSNLSLPELQTKMGDDRIVSRISNMCSIIHCKKQFRLK